MRAERVEVEPAHRCEVSEAELLRFLGGTAGGQERRQVVRHLLRGCPACLAISRPLWHLVERGARE